MLLRFTHYGDNQRSKDIMLICAPGKQFLHQIRHVDMNLVLLLLVIICIYLVASLQSPLNMSQKLRDLTPW